MSKLALTNIRLITFDVTGTLLKFRNSPGREYGNIGNLYGIDCDEHELNSKIKQSIKNLNHMQPNFGRYSGLGWEKWWHKVVESSFQDFTNDSEIINSITKDLIDIYKTPLCWKHTFGSIDLLDALRTKKVHLGVISNFDQRLSVILKNLKINHYFDFVINSYDAGCEKPDDQIFRCASNLSKIKQLLPEECMHIGNSPELDYKAAIDVGWNAALISKGAPEQFSGIPQHTIFASLNHLQKQLFMDIKCKSTKRNVI